MNLSESCVWVSKDLHLKSAVSDNYGNRVTAVCTCVLMLCLTQESANGLKKLFY